MNQMEHVFIFSRRRSVVPRITIPMSRDLPVIRESRWTWSHGAANNFENHLENHESEFYPLHLGL